MFSNQHRTQYKAQRGALGLNQNNLCFVQKFNDDSQYFDKEFHVAEDLCQVVFFSNEMFLLKTS